MATEINELTELAYEASGLPLTTTPVVGTPARAVRRSVRARSRAAGVRRDPGDDPGQRRSVREEEPGVGVAAHRGGQRASGDFFFFDLGSGSLANFDGLRPAGHLDHQGVPVATCTPTTSATCRRCCGASPRPDAATRWRCGARPASTSTSAPAPTPDHLEAAHAWDMKSMCGHPGQSGARAITTEVPYDRPEVVYQRNGVTITSFPVIHIHNGAVGYRLDYAGRSVVFSGDTRPCRYLVEACDGADLLIHETFPTAAVFSQKAGHAPGARRDDRQRRPHQPGHGRQGVRAGRRPDVGDVAPRRRPRDRRPGVLRDAHPATTAPWSSARTSPCSTSPRTSVVARQATIDPFRLAGRRCHRTSRARRCRRRSTRPRGGPTP